MTPQDDLPIGTMFDFGRVTLVVVKSVGGLCVSRKTECALSGKTQCVNAKCSTNGVRTRQDGEDVIFVPRDAYLIARLAGEV